MMGDNHIEVEKLGYVENEEYLRWIVDSVTDGIWEWDIKTNKTYFSPTWKKVLGYEDNEIDNHVDAWTSLIHPDDIKYVLNTHYLYMDKRIPKLEVRYRIKTKEGSYKWILGRGKAIWDKEGKPIYVVGTHTDITEHMLAQEELKESEERYRKLIELSPDAVFVHIDEKYVYANNAGLKLFGIEKWEDLKGRTIWEFTHPQNKELVHNRIKKAHKEKKVLPTVEQRVIKGDGTVINVEVSTNSIPYNGKQAILTMVRDVSERKKAELEIKKIMQRNQELLQQLLKYDKFRTEFFSNISHELRTPLNVILGIVQLLIAAIQREEEIEHDKLVKYTKTMKQNCYRLLRIINNLIDITKIDTGFMSMDMKNYDIVNVIEEIAMSVAEYTKLKGISLTFDTEVEEKIVACDADKIERVFLNLLSNAIKFSKEKGEIWIYIYDKEDKVIISVKDTGIGIPKEKLEHIFDRFVQADSSLHRKFEGSGIGLSLVKSIIEAHDGKISVVSQEGNGTEFLIELPVRRMNKNIGQKPEETNSRQVNVEWINIEFSDIYS